MSVTTRLLEQAGRLLDVSTRADAARELARDLGGTSLLIFLRDETEQQMRPAPGMSQAIPASRAWRTFLMRCVQSGRQTDRLPIYSADQRESVYGVSASPDMAVVLVGASAAPPAMDEFRLLLPLLSAGLRAERQAAKAPAADAQAARAAEKANRAKSEFLTTMSHELRTPLNAISGYVQLLQIGALGQLSEPQREALERVQRSQQNLLHLINDILSLARIEAGAITYHCADVGLNDVARSLIPVVEPQMKEKRQVCSLTLPEQEVYARADREMLDQIMLNLISNAVKFTPEGGCITLAAGYEPDCTDAVFIAVTDTGPGISEDKLESIFEAFVQAHSGLTRTHEGSGLGLAISRDLALGMNGDLSVSSEVGVGSTFKLRLPGRAHRPGAGRPSEIPAHHP